MDDVCETLEYLCNAPQRLRILDVLNGAQMDIRDLMDVLDSPRSTVQRNLTGLEKRGWVNRTASGYMTTTAGRLLHEVVVELNETTNRIQCLIPFFETVGIPPEIDISQISDTVVTTPESGQPNAPTKQLFEAFEGADRLRGFLPAVSGYMVELFRNAERSIIEHEYIVPADVFTALDEQYPDDWMDETRTSHPIHLEIRLYEDGIPYGLFISEKRVAVAVYDEVNRMDVLVESTAEEAVKWGEKMYNTYRQQSTELRTEIPHMAQNVEWME